MTARAHRAAILAMILVQAGCALEAPDRHVVVELAPPPPLIAVAAPVDPSWCGAVLGGRTPVECRVEGTGPPAIFCCTYLDPVGCPAGVYTWCANPAPRGCAILHDEAARGSTWCAPDGTAR